METFEVESLLERDIRGVNGFQQDATQDSPRPRPRLPWISPTTTAGFLAFLVFIMSILLIRESNLEDLPTFPVLNETERQLAAHDLAMLRYWNRTSDKPRTFHNLHEQHRRKRYLLNSIRIPKAGSSHLSMIARALAGCRPDGYPCCKGPAHACPRGDLTCPAIIGCVDHRPKYEKDTTAPLITTLRHPASRLLSGFFYNPPHRPKPKDDYSWSTFESYIAAPEYRNVMTKMLTTASFAYRAFEPSEHTVSAAQDRLCQFAWFGINELPLLSALLLYESPVFWHLQPNRVVFGLPAIGSAYAPPQTSKDYSMRINDGNPLYPVFQATTFVENNGTELVRQYNQEDLTLYEWAVQLFCARVRDSGLAEAARPIAFEEVAFCSELGLSTVQDLCIDVGM